MLRRQRCKALSVVAAVLLLGSNKSSYCSVTALVAAATVPRERRIWQNSILHHPLPSTPRVPKAVGLYDPKRVNAATTITALRGGKSDDASSLSSRTLVLTVGATTLAGLTAAAAAGILPGYSTDRALLQHDVIASVSVGVLAYIYLKIWTTLAANDVVSSRDARKLIHLGSGPLFMALWPGFSPVPAARVFAAWVPAVNALRLYLAGAGDTSEAALAASVSRSGDAREAWHGPLIYVVWITLATLLGWRDSVVAVVALTNLAAGDGLADLIGRRWGRNNKWPGLGGGGNKSVAGSLAFWLGATGVSYVLVTWLQYWHCLVLTHTGTDLVLRLATIALGAAAVELVPVADDNYTVPVTAAVLAYYLL